MYVKIGCLIFKWKKSQEEMASFLRIKIIDFAIAFKALDL